VTATFWQSVTSGRIRLSKYDDRLLWDMRALGHGFDAIAAEITRRIAARSEAGAKLAARRYAKRWREEYRRERA
jgi:hypothetical protein